MALLRAREAVMKKFIPHLRANDLSPQQWRVLRALSETGELEMNEIAQRCYLLMPSLSRIIQYLDSRDLVERRISDRDQRRSIIRISETGRQLVAEMSHESEARYDHITEVFGYGKLELLYELLDELVVKLDSAELNHAGEKRTLEKCQ